MAEGRAVDSLTHSSLSGLGGLAEFVGRHADLNQPGSGDEPSESLSKLEPNHIPRFLNNEMCGFWVLGFLLVIGLSSSACILRPGMNTDCAWPPEAPRRLDLTNSADRRHLVVDAELVEELVDRYRFHVPNEQPECEKRLIDAVARTHSVGVSDVASARDRIPEKGLDLPVSVPVAVFFVFTVLGVARRIERRFRDETLPAIITLVIASVTLAGLFVMVGEFWTSILQMIRVGSQHVGGRVSKLPWLQHQQQIFILGIVLFWIVVLLRLALLRLRLRQRPSTETVS